MKEPLDSRFEVRRPVSNCAGSLIGVRDKDVLVRTGADWGSGGSMINVGSSEDGLSEELDEPVLEPLLVEETVDSELSDELEELEFPSSAFSSTLS